MNKFFDKFFQGITKINTFNEVLAEIGAVVLAIIVIWGVMLTYVFGKSDIFSVEISEYLLILLCFFSIAYVQKENRHVTVDIMTEKLSDNKRQILGIITSLLCLIFCLVVGWEAANVSMMNYQRNFYSTSLIRFPMWAPYLIISYGFVMLTLQFLVNIYNLFVKLTVPGNSK
jgi:C4-dicarboxylate transporter, DctQ subunit